jgi:HSP20 family protein
MAQTRTETKRTEQETERAMTRQNEGRGLRRWDPGLASNPFELMDRMSQEMDRWFERFIGGGAMPRGLGLWRTPTTGRRMEAWFPRIEAGQKGDQFIVRADLPGLRKEDVDVEVTSDAITIRGERREEQQEEREGYWRSEREYGQFYRTIPVPEGAMADNANATFKDGVLEITMPCPPSEANRGRRLEIK